MNTVLIYYHTENYNKSTSTEQKRENKLFCINFYLALLYMYHSMNFGLIRLKVLRTK